MLVTDIKSVTKTKYKIFIDEQFAFTLYKGELSRYHIKENVEIDEETMEEIKAVVLKRAKLRAMHLLADMDRTEAQIRTKLAAGGYGETIVEQALSYVKQFGYINDLNYARRFVESKKRTKSKKEIYALLSQKGLSRELVGEALEECYDREDAGAAIKEIMRKRRYDPGIAEEAETRKLYAYLAGKGFAYEDIRQVIQVSGRNA